MLLPVQKVGRSRFCFPFLGHGHTESDQIRPDHSHKQDRNCSKFQSKCANTDQAGAALVPAWSCTRVR